MSMKGLSFPMDDTASGSRRYAPWHNAKTALEIDFEMGNRGWVMLGFLLKGVVAVTEGRTGRPLLQAGDWQVTGRWLGDRDV